MKDGYSETDRELKRLEKKIKKEYSEALKRMQKKADDYFRRFEANDRKKYAEFMSGDISEKEYTEWRRNKMLSGEYYKQMVNNLSKDLANAKEIADGYVNGAQPTFYAMGMNYAGYEVEVELGASTVDFALINKEAVEGMIKRGKVKLPKRKAKILKEERWNMKKINSALLQSILAGDSIPKIAKHLKSVAKMNETQSIRTARTLATGAENLGHYNRYHEARQKGIPLLNKWNATKDSRTRLSHRLLDGEERAEGELFSNNCRFPGDPECRDGGEIYNCFVGETSVCTNSEIIRTYKHEYKGELITIETAAGVKFTCTPNHPVLSINGWIAANALNNGDNILVTVIGDEIMARRNPNIKHIFTRFDTLHKFFNIIGGKRICALGVNFHGDIPTTDVEVITQKRFLGDNRNVSITDGVYKFLFMLANKAFVSKCTFLKHFKSVMRTTFSNIGGVCKSFSLFKGGLSHSNKHGLRPIARFNSDGIESLFDNVAADPELLSKCLNGFVGVVFADKIINIKRDSGCTHVYNLQSENGYYFVNSSISNNKQSNNGIMAIVHNCRCRLTAVIEGYKYAEVGLDTSKMDGLSYEEWKHTKPTYKKKKR